jgi:hypothetical protein
MQRGLETSMLYDALLLQPALVQIVCHGCQGVTNEMVAHLDIYKYQDKVIESY